MPIWPFVVAAAGLTAVAVWGKAPGRMAVHWIAKPLSVSAVIALALCVPTQLSSPSAYRALLAALILSLVGDLFLMFKKRFFLAGLISFLLAHVAYLVAMSLEQPWQLSDAGWLLPPVLGAGWVTPRIWSQLGKLKPAVLVYVLALTLVAFRLLARVGERDGIGLVAAGFSAAGAILFVTADSILALRYFAKRHFPYIIEFTPYVAAQLCIVLGTVT
jgi:uncharacterized membrane protein YhhN